MSTQGIEEAVPLVTGGSRGIGRAISQNLAKHGCHVVINYLSDHSSAEECVAQITQSGGSAQCVQAHLGDAKSRAELFSVIEDQHGRLDYFIANAATGVHRPVTELSANSFKKVLAVNLEAYHDLAQRAIKLMLKQPRLSSSAAQLGRIVAISSLGAERVLPDYGSVGVSKAAIEALTRQIAWEYGPHGITANTVRAGLVDTGVLDYVQGKQRIVEETISRTPLRKLVQTQDVAKLINFLISSDASMITGQTITIDGGFQLTA